MPNDYTPPAKPFGQLTGDERWAWLVADAGTYFDASAAHSLATTRPAGTGQPPRARRWWPFRPQGGQR